MPYTTDIAKELLRSMTFTKRNDRKKKLHSIHRRQMVLSLLGSIDRSKAVKVRKSVRGTRSHYRFAVSMNGRGAVEQNTVRMGFLSCACRACMSCGTEHPDCR